MEPAIADINQRRSSEHIKGLDGLRGFAALSVTFFHGILHFDDSLVGRVLYAPIATIDNANDLAVKFLLMIFNGDAPVMLFFVLSGLVLSLSLRSDLSKKTTAQACIDFVIKRLFRIYPVVIISMGLMYVISLAFGHSGLLPFPIYTFKQCYENMALWNTSMLGPSWSVQVEIMAIPFVLFAFLLGERFGIMALIFSITYGIYSIDYPYLVLFMPNMWVYLCGFIMGVALSYPAILNSTATLPRSVVGITLFVFIATRHIVSRNGISSIVAQAILAALVVFSVAKKSEGFTGRILSSKPAQIMGKISFSFYLINVPILGLVWAMIEKYVPHPEVHSTSIGLASALATTIIAVPISLLAERYVERPGIRAGRIVVNALRRSSGDKHETISA